MTGLDPSDLVLVLAVVEEGSLTGAARRLGTSQPALSRSLRALERRVGTELFDRLPRGMRPTAAGELLAENARAVAAATRQADRELDAHLRGAVELHVGLVVELPVVPVARALSELVAGAERSATIRIGTRDELVDELRAGELDVLIGSVPDDVHGLAVEPLFEERPVLVAGPGRPVTIAGLADLADRPWIAPPPDVPAWSAVLDAFRGAGLELPRPAIVTGDVPLTVRLLAEGDFVAVLPSSVASFAEAPGLLVVLDIDLGRPATAIALMHRRSPSPGSAVAALATLLAERLAG